MVQALTHRGGVRAHNEDTIAVGDWIAANDLEQAKSFTFRGDGAVAVIVADGMGGHAAGDVASRAATALLVDRAPELTTAQDAEAALRAVNRELYAMMASGRGAPGMGTTVAGLVVHGAGVVSFNVGDSRVYRFDGAALTQLSTDDTPGPKLEDGRTAATTTPLITQSLGGQTAFTEIAPHAEAEPRRPGACYLLCSDGLSDLLGPQAIAARLQDGDDAAAVRALFTDAMDRGGKDNISIALVRIAAASGEARAGGGGAGSPRR